MTFDHDFGYSFPLFSSLLKKNFKKGRRKGEWIAKIVIKSDQDKYNPIKVKTLKCSNFTIFIYQKNEVKSCSVQIYRP